MLKALRSTPGFAALTFLCMALTGCVAVATRESYSVEELHGARISGRDDLRFFPAQNPDLQSALGWSETPPAVPDGRFDILALSSGGPDGAFGAGALKGLARTAKRPDYEIVTGISTGAIMAPFVFTGAQNDRLIESFYTSGEMASLVGPPNVLAALSGPALYSDAKIVPFVNRNIDVALMRRVAAEHGKGRRLLIGTANLDAHQLTIWNMGRIAEIGTPEALALFRKVVRASFSIPGALPPVEIASTSTKPVRELHGDGGVIAYFYADPELVPPVFRSQRKPDRGKASRARIDIILHNQIEAQPAAVQARTIDLAGVSVSNLTRSGMRLLLDNTLRKAADLGVDVRYAYLPSSRRTVSSLEFDIAYMRDTFEFGYRSAVDGTLWQTGRRR
ncbi:MAG: patatin-like phospholipase family protein [Nitratireductor sp.]|nr:patatin-like phospholipase family protein [Nitratireductor sp.]